MPPGAGVGNSAGAIGLLLATNLAAPLVFTETSLPGIVSSTAAAVLLSSTAKMDATTRRSVMIAPNERPMA